MVYEMFIYVQLSVIKGSQNDAENNLFSRFIITLKKRQLSQGYFKYL